MISVVIPTYNASRFLANCIDTIRQQRTPPLELVFVDDASSDTSVACIRRLTQSLQITARVLELGVNGGPSRARNAGMSEACGEWIAFLDVDDVWSPDHLESLTATAARAKVKVDVAFSGLSVVDTRTDRLLLERSDYDQLDVPLAFLTQSPIMPSQAMINRRLFDAGGRFDEALRHGEDADFWLTVAQLGATFACSNRPTCTYQKHADTPSQDAEKIAEGNAYRLMKHLESGLLPRRTIIKLAKEQHLAAARLAWRKNPTRAVRHLLRMATTTLP